MSKSAGSIFGLLLLGLCVGAMLVGTQLLMTSSGMQPHTDEVRAQDLSRLYTSNFVTAPQQLDGIARKIAALRSAKYNLYDAGLALCLFFGMILVGIIHFALWDLRNFRAMQSPQSRSKLLALATLALLGLVSALVIQTNTEWLRDDLAPTIDTGRGMILFVAPALFLALWLPMFVVGRYWLLRRSSFPASLWRWNKIRSRGDVARNVCFGLLVVMLTILLIGSALYFITAIPSIMIGFYVIFSSRAALLEHAALSSSTSHA